jgi:hypothetical protein
MVSLDQHPTVFHHRAHAADRALATLDAPWLTASASRWGPTTSASSRSVARSWPPNGPAGELAATYHVEFTGPEKPVTATVVIRRSWIRFLAKERGLVGALLRRTIRLRGDPRLLLAFRRCFPS